MKEAVRLAVRAILADGNRVTNDRVRGNGAGGVPLKLIKETLKEWRAGVLDIDASWKTVREDTGGPNDLVEAVMQADTYEGIGLACRMVMEETAKGTLSGAKATALKALLSEARQSLKQQHAETPPEVEDEIVPVSYEAFELAVLWEGIVSDKGRQRVIDVLRTEVKRDLRENPNTDGART